MASKETIDYINVVRTEELKRVLNLHEAWFSGKDLLELGSGSGAQLEILSSVCRSATGLELPDDGYKEHRTAEVKEYDGKSIPFPDAAFDIVFSSHVLQYVTHEKELYAEMRRVLRPGGVAVHVVPTSVWRIWSSVLHYPAMTQLAFRKFHSTTGAGSSDPKASSRPGSRLLRDIVVHALLQHRHGSKGNWLTEHIIFRTRAWRQRLAQYGWTAEKIEPLGLWYSAYSLLGPGLSLERRSMLARIFGSATATILARPQSTA